MVKGDDDVTKIAYLSNEPRVGASIARKINLGDYESVDIFMSITGLEPGCSDAEIEEALATGERVLFFLRKKMQEKLVEVRKAGRHE